MASLNKKTTTAGQSGGVKPAKAQKIKPVKPQILEQAEKETDTKKLFQLFGKTGISHPAGGYWRASHYGMLNYKICGRLTRYLGSSDKYEMRYHNSGPADDSMLVLNGGAVKHGSSGTFALDMDVMYVGEDATVWLGRFATKCSNNINGKYDGVGRGYVPYTGEVFWLSGSVQVSPFKAIEKVVTGALCLQSDAELKAIIRKNSPWAADWVESKNVIPINYLMAPYLETLNKAGYAFVDRFLHVNLSSSSVQQADIERLNRLCKRGKNPAEIFKTSKAVYKVLGPTEMNMELWDTYRKMDKFGRITQETIQEAHDHAMSPKDMDLIYQILSKSYKGHQVFSWDSLYRYLMRLDRFEAIPTQEALFLIRDYLNMCQMLNMAPRVDGDSLKREHDVAARLCRNLRNEKMAQSMLPACKALSKYDYNEGVYFIRGIQSFDDLMDEATQQHSCLVSYGEDIAAGKSKIYVMRETARPERSLITVELSADHRNIRQALKAYNKPIYNKSQHEFLDRWLRYVRDLDRYSA